MVGAQVALGEGVELVSHAVVAGDTDRPAQRIFPFASIGHQPQDLKYGEPSTLASAPTASSAKA